MGRDVMQKRAAEALEFVVECDLIGHWCCLKQGIR